MVPQDPEYFHAIGLAAVAFARLEWDAVWCCERLAPGYINTIEKKKKTAGTIAGDLVGFFERIDDIHLKAKVVPFAQQYGAVVLERNGLLHGKPATAPNGDQRLFRNGEEWSVSKVQAFAGRCVIAGAPLNALLYAEFAEPCQVTLRAN